MSYLKSKFKKTNNKTCEKKLHLLLHLYKKITFTINLKNNINPPKTAQM